MAEPLHPPRRHLRSLTSLRFFAAFWVVLYHYTPPYLKEIPEPIRQFVMHGHEGVTLFFVLSGFILAYTYGGRAAEGRLDRREFWRARFARVYPVFAFCLILAFPMTALWLLENHPKDLAFFLPGIPAYGLLLHSWWHPLIYRLQWNTPSWSLSAEAFFYLSFPWIAARLMRSGRKGLLASVVGMALAIAGLRLAYVLANPDGVSGAIPDPTNHLWAGILYYNPLLRLPEFVLGVAMAPLAKGIGVAFQGRPERAYAALASILAALFLLFAFETTLASSVLVYPLVRVLFGALILALAVEETPLVDRLLALPLLVLLGEASYSMYMLQRPVGAIVDLLASRLGIGGILQVPLTLAGFLVVLVGSSILAYKRIEIPWRNRLRPRTAPPPAA